MNPRDTSSNNRAALLLAFAVIVGAVVLVLPALMVRPKGQLTAAERLRAENDVRTTLIQMLGGAALLTGVYFTARTVRLSAETLEATRDGQITERFTRAIEHLGNTDSLEVRLGGIYALERIARESAQDHGPIMEVLTAFVREHAHWTDGESGPPSVDADVQAVMTVLGRRPEARREAERAPLVLNDVDLRGADLTRAHLEGAYLEKANLEGADLWEAHFEGANLSGANLKGARLYGANFRGAYLIGANLHEGHLTRVKLGGVHLEGANLEGAHLANVNLEGAHLEGVKLQGADLSWANLEGADLRRADLKKAQVNMAHLGGALLDGAHLEGANLQGVYGLVRTQLDATYSDSDTVLPAWPNEV